MSLTSKSLTPEKVSRLHEAIDRAKSPGACSYVIDDGPGCVIGQLAALEGVDIKHLRAWDGQNPLGGMGVYRVMDRQLPGYLAFEDYPRDLLPILQDMWDCGASRAAMHELVDRYASAASGGESHGD